jgi:hypothetical protein
MSQSLLTFVNICFIIGCWCQIEFWCSKSISYMTAASDGWYQYIFIMFISLMGFLSINFWIVGHRCPYKYSPICDATSLCIVGIIPIRYNAYLVLGRPVISNAVTSFHSAVMCPHPPTICHPSSNCSVQRILLTLLYHAHQ